MNELGRRIRETRRDKGFTLQELARETGISYQAIGQYERGERNPSFAQMERLAKAFNMPVADLIGDDRRLNEALQASILNSPQVLKAHSAATKPMEGMSDFDLLDKVEELRGEPTEILLTKLWQWEKDATSERKNALQTLITAADELAGDGVGYVLLRFLKAYRRLNETGREHALQYIEDMTQVKRFQKESEWKRVFPPEV